MGFRQKMSVLLGMGLLMAPATSVFAASELRADDPAIENAKMCTQNISRYERRYAIPSHLLSAIAATESGRYHKGLKLALPWPWTINAEGQGHYFNSKAEAVSAVRRLQAQGVKSIDIGCMQVNLVHHANAFASLEEAFDPERNVAYAASFLRTLYEENRSWKTAAAYYHSRTPSRGTDYAGKVFGRWYNIVDRLRLAKADVVKDRTDDKVMMASSAMTASPRVVNVKPQVVSDKSGYHAPRMNSISITNADSSRDNGVLVIRPKITVADDSGDSVTVVQTTPVSAAVTGAKVIHMADQRPVNVAPKIAGPRFIFEN